MSKSRGLAIKKLFIATTSCRCLPMPLQKNHLSGLQRKLLKITFWNVQALMEVRKELFPIISRNKGRSAVNDALTALQQQQQMQQQMVAGGRAAMAGLHSASRVSGQKSCSAGIDTNETV